MTAIAERRLEHLLKGLPPDRQAEILAALHNEIAQERQRRIESEALRALGDVVSLSKKDVDGPSYGCKSRLSKSLGVQ